MFIASTTDSSAQNGAKKDKRVASFTTDKSHMFYGPTIQANQNEK